MNENLLQTDAHHDPAFFEIPYNTVDHPSQHQTQLLYRVFKHDNYNGIVDFLKEISWENLLSLNNVETNVKSFYDSLFTAMNQYFPVRTNLNNESFSHWYTPDLEQLIFQKKSAYAAWKRSLDLCEYIEFKRLRAACIAEFRSAYIKHIEQVESKIKSNPKASWNFAKRLKRDDSYIESMFLKNKKANPQLEIAQTISSLCMPILF